ncbi:MAG: ABC transporter ATP-binding protein, partial [Deltaproteobacteria bacterium]|nr:ABC transporter ATP-binding protein [Deltaproteobacteria bacterium]
MDEPSIGLSPIMVELLGKVIVDINGKGSSVFLVEQNVHLALGVATYAYALQVGKVVLSGDIETMKSSDIVKRAYLGG